MPCLLTGTQSHKQAEREDRNQGKQLLTWPDAACGVCPVQVAPGILHSPPHCEQHPPSSACRLSQHHLNALEFVCSLACYSWETSLQFCKLSMNCCIQVEWNQLETVDGFTCITLLSLTSSIVNILCFSFSPQSSSGTFSVMIELFSIFYFTGGIWSVGHKTAWYKSSWSLTVV